MAQVEKRQYDEAITAFERVLKEVPDYPARDKILYELGWAWADKQDTAKSAAYLQELIDKFPNSDLVPEAVYQLAQQQFDARQYDKAAPLYASVVTKSNSQELQEKAVLQVGLELVPTEQVRRGSQGISLASGEVSYRQIHYRCAVYER